MAAVRRVREKISQLCGAATNCGPCIGSCNPEFVRRPYETDDTVFLYIVRVEYPSLYEMAFVEEGAILVVPAGISLAAHMTLEDVQNHVIYETRVPGEYITVSGKKVFIDGNELCTAEGFEEERRVRILVNEEIDDPAHGGKKLRVLQVSRPLEGGVHAPDEQQDEMDTGSLRKYVAILRSNPEVEGVFRDMDAFIAEVNFLGQHAPDGFKRVTPSLETCVLAQWQSSAGALQESAGLFTEDYYLGGVARERHRLQVAQMVESYLVGGIHRTLYPWLQQQHAAKDQQLSQVLHRLRYYSASDVGLSPEFHCPVHEAVAQLAKMADCTTPLEKLLCLKAVALKLFRLVQQHLRAHFPNQLGDLQLATDDLVHLITYTIIRAYPQSSSLLLDLRYIRDFHLVSTSTSATGYYYNSFEVAVDFLLSKLGLSVRDDEGEEGDTGTGEAKGGEQVEEGAPRTDDQARGEEVQRGLAKLAPPQSDVVLLENVRTVLEERGLSAEAVGLAPPAVTPSGGDGRSSKKAGGVGEETDDDEDDQEEEGPRREGGSTTGGGDEAAARDSKGQMVMVFGDGGVRLRGDQAQSQVVTVEEEGQGPQQQTSIGDSKKEAAAAMATTVIKQAAAGQQFFAVVTGTGELQTWGLPEGGRLGHGHQDEDLDLFFPTLKPERVAPPLRTEAVAQVVCGAQHVLAITATGDLFSWGDNRCGQLGHGRRSLSSPSPCQYTPKHVDFLAGQAVTVVAAGNLHSLALTSDGQVYSWGRAQGGRLGRLHPSDCGKDEFSPGLILHDWSAKEEIPVEYSGTSTSSSPTTTKEAEGSKEEDEGRGAAEAEAEEGKASQVVGLAAGWSHSLAVLSDGRVMAWGAGVKGRLGLGSYSDEYSPREVRALSSPYLRVVQASAGYGHSVFLTDHGEVFSCGYNKFGQLGLPSTGLSCYPEVGVSSTRTKVPVELLPRRVKGALKGVQIVSITAGENHTAARSADGRVFTWGLNLGNQCGHGRAVEQQAKPKEVAILRGAKQVSCGAAHTVVIM